MRRAAILKIALILRLSPTLSPTCEPKPWRRVNRKIRSAVLRRRRTG
jgi:hypothetical protein